MYQRQINIDIETKIQLEINQLRQKQVTRPQTPVKFIAQKRGLRNKCKGLRRILVDLGNELDLEQDMGLKLDLSLQLARTWEKVLSLKGVDQLTHWHQHLNLASKISEATGRQV